MRETQQETLKIENECKALKGIRAKIINRKRYKGDQQTYIRVTKNKNKNNQKQTFKDVIEENFPDIKMDLRSTHVKSTHVRIPTPAYPSKNY